MKKERIQGVVDGVLGRFQATAASSAAAAKVAPPVKQATSGSARAEKGAVPGSDIYLPEAGSAPGGRTAGDVQGKERSAEDKGFADIRRRMGRGGRSRSRSRDRDRRARSRSRRRRSRSKSGRKKSMFDKSGDTSEATRPGQVPKSAPAEPGRPGSKFSDSASVQISASGNDVPDWLKDLAEPQIPRALLGRKVLRMPDAYIKCLIGRGGETIRQIINKTGADIRIEAKQDNLDGIVSIANNIEAAEKLIKEILASKGCHWQTQMASDMGGELTNVGWKGHVDDDDLQIPTELVGLFIGNAGAGIKEIKARVGGAVTIKVLPPLLPGGFQCVQVVGENWKAAREVVRQKIKQILQETPGRWHAPGFSKTNPNMGGGQSNAPAPGYMPSFGATPGMSYSREQHREGATTNVIQTLSQPPNHNHGLGGSI